MNQEPDNAAQESIVAKILSDGEAQAKRVIDNAGRSVASEKRKAESEAARIRKDMLGKAEAKSRTLRQKVIATGHIEAKRMLLRAREDAITMVLKTIEQELAKIRENPAEYRRALANLAVEAVLAVGGAEVTLTVGTEDQALADQAFLNEITERTRHDADGEITIVLLLDPALTGGGCIAVSRQGRIVFDNSFARRLERMKPALRSVIVQEVLKTDG
jgi:vacuolar-type H+-ATPase subunit E/Vma4